MQPIIWAWAENILNKERKQDYANHDRNTIDENQNDVFNVNLGLRDFSYLQLMEEMGNLLIKKKVLAK